MVVVCRAEGRDITGTPGAFPRGVASLPKPWSIDENDRLAKGRLKNGRAGAFLWLEMWVALRKQNLETRKLGK